MGSQIVQGKNHEIHLLHVNDSSLRNSTPLRSTKETHKNRVDQRNRDYVLQPFGTKVLGHQVPYVLVPIIILFNRRSSICSARYGITL